LINLTNIQLVVSENGFLVRRCIKRPLGFTL